MKIAHLCTAHGFGHITRQIAIGESMRKYGCTPTYFCHRPELLQSISSNTVQWQIDVGFVQHDSLQIDIPQTLLALEKICSEEQITRLAKKLTEFDGAIADIPPPGLEACRLTGLPVIATSNFEWPWIYSHYPSLKRWEERFQQYQANHNALFLEPGPGLFHFHQIDTGPYVSRPAKPYKLPKTSILLSFGGMGLDKLSKILPRIPDVTWVMAPPCPHLEREDILYVEGIPYQDIIAGSDIIFSKAGYGIISEAMRSGKPLILVERDSFPESPYLEKHVEERGDIIIRCGTSSPHIFKQHLKEAVMTTLKRPPIPAVPNGVEEVAKYLFEKFKIMDT